MYSCKSCKRLDEHHFDEIEEYLKQFPNSNAMQVAEEIGITAFEVLKYLQEGRLVMSKGEFSKL